MDSSVNPRMSLSILSAYSTSGLSPGTVVFGLDRREFSRYVESLQMTDSDRINSIAALNANDETRGNNTVQAGDFSVSERNFDRQTHTHHIFQENVSKIFRKSSLHLRKLNSCSSSCSKVNGGVHLLRDVTRR